MNYERIYNEFICDRRLKEKEYPKTKYTELHHIIPKCMGGTNEKENLIRLTPEDHFFAHLLLAKAFGEKNWLALHSMLHRGMKTEAISYKDFSNKRKQFGFIRRLVSANFSGLNNTQADKNIYILRNKDGLEVKGDRKKIEREIGLSSRSIGKLVTGKIKISKGWYFPMLNPEGLTGYEITKKEETQSLPELTLYHFDGREWKGTSFDFYKEFGKQLVFYKNESFCNGWCRNKALAEAYLQSKLNNPVVSRRLYKFQEIGTDIVLYHSQSSLSKYLKIPKEKALELILGKIGQIKGIKLLSDPAKYRKKPNNKFYKFKFIETGLICKMSIPQMSKKYKIPQTRLCHNRKAFVRRRLLRTF